MNNKRNEMLEEWKLNSWVAFSDDCNKFDKAEIIMPYIVVQGKEWRYGRDKLRLEKRSTNGISICSRFIVVTDETWWCVSASNLLICLTCAFWRK